MGLFLVLCVVVWSIVFVGKQCVFVRGTVQCRISSGNSIFLVEFSGNTGRNSFLTSIASQKIFRPYFQKWRLEYYFLCLFYFSSPYSGHFRSNFVVLLLLLTARSRRTRKADQKCPEKQDKKSKRDMKINITIPNFTESAWRLHKVKQTHKTTP